MSTMKWNFNNHVWGWVYLWKYALKNSYISRHFGGLGIEKIRQNLGQTADSLSHLAFSSRLVFGAWCFTKPCWDLVGFRSLRLGFQISMLGIPTLRLGFQISMLGFTALRLAFRKKTVFFPKGSRKVVKPSMLIWKPSRKVEKPSMLIWKPSRKLRKPTKTQP